LKKQSKEGEFVKSEFVKSEFGRMGQLIRASDFHTNGQFISNYILRILNFEFNRIFDFCKE